jgi:peptide/nickel transport system permease protein
MNAILRTVLQRLALGLLSLLAVSVIIFSAIDMLPGDFAQSLLGQSATPQTVAEFKHELGLDRPPIQQYIGWATGALRGDFGKSFASQGTTRPSVAKIIEPRLYNTLFLALTTAVVAVPLALGLGVLAALFRNSLLDRLINLMTLTAVSVPEFFGAYLVMLFLAIKARIFFTFYSVEESTSFLDQLQACALPAITLTLVILAHMMRMTRTSIVSLLSTSYVEMARLKGVPNLRIIVKHILPNAWGPIANVIAVNLAYLIVGVVVVEVVFVYPGIGQLMVDAVKSRNIPVVQACALIFAATYILLKLLADVIAIVTNPRLLHPR